MIKKTRILLLFFGMVLVLSLFLPGVFAQGAIRERIKEKWLERKGQRKEATSNSEGAGNGEYQFTLENNGLVRKYNVNLPAGYNKNNPAPVVIFLHGGGGSIKSAYQEGLDKAAGKCGFILVVPAGTGILPASLLTWNAGKWYGGECCGPSVRDNIDDVGFIAQMIEEVKRKFNVNENRIYATGISNGAMMAYRIACELSDKVAAVAAVAPPAIPAGCSPSCPISIMQINGTKDPCVPINGGLGGGCLGKATFQVQPAREMAAEWAKMNQCSENYVVPYQEGSVTCAAYSPCSSKTEVKFCEIEGGGHTWPSGNQYMPVDKVGPVSYDISFDQIWEFFRQHPKNK